MERYCLYFPDRRKKYSQWFSAHHGIDQDIFSMNFWYSVVVFNFVDMLFAIVGAQGVLFYWTMQCILLLVIICICSCIHVYDNIDVYMLFSLAVNDHVYVSLAYEKYTDNTT